MATVPSRAAWSAAARLTDLDSRAGATANPPSAIAPAPYALVRSAARREGRNRSKGGSGVVTTSSYTGTDRPLSRPGLAFERAAPGMSDPGRSFELVSK